jgi:4-diphosphocytidyl-2-C-methyl-D-erythritol kinase
LHVERHGGGVTEPLAEHEGRSRFAAHGSVRVRVPAKINLHLGVGPLRADGYHELVTVYHAIDLHDELTARPHDDLALTLDGEGTGELPLDGDNLVIRAVRALSARTGRAPRARLHLRKQIPVAGGLAGGSADAAAALVACDALWGTGLSREELAEVAADVGCDVPFLVLGGTALGTGRGERISPVLASGNAWHWVVAVAEMGLATPEVYRELDRLREVSSTAVSGPPDRLLTALRRRDPRALAPALANDLQVAALSLRPALRRTLDAGLAAGALVGIVSGSGPTCVFLATDASHAAEVGARLEAGALCRAVHVARGPVPGARLL